MKWLFIVLGTLAAIAGLVAFIGFFLPLKHTASSAIRLHQSPEKIWGAITDFEAFPSWRSSVVRVEKLPDHAEHTAWKEIDKYGELPMEIIEADTMKKLTMRIIDDGLSFGGTWTFELRPEGDDTHVMITENGKIYNIFFRFMARFVMGYTGTIETYLSDLAKKFGEEAKATRVGKS